MVAAQVKVTADTNVLVRAVMRDDERQARAAAKLLREAELVAVPLPCLCEFSWVLRRVYRIPPAEIAAAIEALVDSANVAVNGPAVEAGLALLKRGGDFADGLIAFEGTWLGGETFASFDRRAVALLAKQGARTRLLS
jgi:predicted nucleic-acid-binding protein